MFFLTEFLEEQSLYLWYVIGEIFGLLNYTMILLLQSSKYVDMLLQIDNLVKGASGQALQNLNLIMGFPENLGLQYLPLFP